MPIAPTLILGLGGTGSKIVEKVAEKVRESDTGQSDRIAYVAFDTDINDLGRIRQDHPEIYTVQTSTRNTVGEYLGINTNARDNWFPVNEMMNRKSLTEGAAQVRAISRLAFDTTLKSGNLTPLHRAIEKLFRIDKDQEEQSLRVIITSSLAGGTGSGIILSVAMYLANYLKAKYPQAKAITRGFFIQPDVFYKVIPGSEERINLQVNAYAAVRELDAFLMKGDNTLPEQYKRLKFEFPRVGADGVDVVNAMPYDFCFLFDAQNKGNGGLDSFASYLDHAATCIYTQSIGPMSKKSNSREDNVLREVIKNDGRNRYAGAGASRLVYPWAHVRDVTGYRWAEQALSQQWLRFDEQIKARQAALAKQRESGYGGRDLDRGLEFIWAVDAAADLKDPFALSIQRQCLTFDKDEINVTGKQWNNYYSSLSTFVRKNTQQAAGDSDADALQDQLADLKEKPQAYTDLYLDLKRYHARSERDAEARAGLIGYELFKSDNQTATKDRHPHQLETYLRERISGNFVHPVSARYFLYQTIERLTKARRTAVAALEDDRSFFETFEEDNFDDKSTADTVETATDFASKKLSVGEMLFKKPDEQKQKIKQSLGQFIEKVEEYRYDIVFTQVLEDAIEYAKGLASAFERFFISLDGNLKRLHSNVEQARTNFDDLSGTTTRYVLASSECLDSVYKSMPYQGGVTSVDSELAEAIYNKVRDYHMLTDEKDEGFFKDLYNNTILKYFSDQVMANYGEQIKIDVIDALEREYRILEHNFEEDNVRHYVKDEIEKAKRLSSPFIEQPLGEERHPISACAYNPVIEGDGEPKRKKFIAELLGDYGGERDEEISPQEILFYNAIYGICARDLGKFAPARESETEHRAAGEYFTSYYNLVSGIKPSVGETKVITPHIDRRWHSISELPDLDDGTQAVQLAKIHKALLFGLAYDRIEWSSAGSGRDNVYRFLTARGLGDDFVVSNGTPCDQFYEVTDALTINPVAVDEILGAVEREKRKERQDTLERYGATKFGTKLAEGFNLEQIVEEHANFSWEPASIFGVAAYSALSMPADEYVEQLSYEMAKDFIDIIADDVESIIDVEEALGVIDEILKEQLSRFANNVENYRKIGGRPFMRKLRTVVLPLVHFAEDRELDELRAQAKELDTQLRRMD
ncbi:MAG: tubulin-like doman-containing protein [Galactobacter sp.]